MPVRRRAGHSALLPSGHWRRANDRNRVYGLDWNLRFLLHELKRLRPESVPCWAIARSQNPVHNSLWKKRAVTVYAILLDDFATSLSQALAPRRTEGV